MNFVGIPQSQSPLRPSPVHEATRLAHRALHIQDAAQETCTRRIALSQRVAEVSLWLGDKREGNFCFQTKAPGRAKNFRTAVEIGPGGSSL